MQSLRSFVGHPCISLPSLSIIQCIDVISLIFFRIARATTSGPKKTLNNHEDDVNNINNINGIVEYVKTYCKRKKKNHNI